MLTNKTIDADSNTISNIDDNEIKSAAAIDVSKLSSGIVSNTEFDFIDGLDQNLGTTDSVTFSNLTATTNVITDNIVERTSGSGVDIDTLLLKDSGLRFDEVSANPITSTAGTGILWVKDNIPSELFYTDDTNVDHNLLIPLNKAWSFQSPTGGATTYQCGGYIQDSGTNDDFDNGGIPTSFGTANIAKSAHVFLVNSATVGGSDLVILIEGTSTDDIGSRTASDSESLTFDASSAANQYKETVKKWLGTIDITFQTGTSQDCNFGFVKYWDNSNHSFTVTGLEFTGLAGASDTGFDCKLLHHRATGWTYTVSGATPPTEIASWDTDLSPESNIQNDENFGWKRDNLSTLIRGDLSEGVILEITTSTGKTLLNANFSITYI